MKIGIDLGGSHLAIGLVDDNKKIIERCERYFTNQDKEDIVKVIEEYISNVVQDMKNKYPNEIEKVGIAVPGTVKDGKIIKTVNLNINNYDITSALKESLNLPISLANDGKCACIAEYDNLIETEKISKDLNVLLLNIGTGIGGGVIYNGELLKGRNFDGFEFGHIVIKENGIPCRCGKRGCFERYGSILEYKNKVKQRLNIDYNINGDDLREIMALRENEIEDLKTEYVSDLALGISNLINIFEPDILVIGGGFAHFSYMFIDDIKNLLINSNLLFNKRNDIDIRIAKLENDAGIIGATL